MNALRARLNVLWWVGRQTLIWTNVFAIDAVLVAISWQQLLSLVMRDRLATLAESAALSLAVWVVYTGDHLLDGFRVKPDRFSSRRHRWHHDHARMMTWLTIIAGLASATVSLVFLSRDIVAAGLVLASLVLAYGLAVHAPMNKRVPTIQVWKEPLVGLGYAFGVGLCPLTESANAKSVGTILLFAALCTSNCLVVAFAERDQDRQHGFHSVPLRYPSLIKPLRWGLVALGLGSLVGCYVAVRPDLFLIAVAISAGTLWLAERYLRHDEELVTLADLALILGALGGIIGWTRA
ncbi:MAG: hypothetical protein AAGD07_15205 [Planctomycetota bacterium]